MQDKPSLVYTRVSGKAQAEEGSSLGSQEKACRELARERGVAVAEVFREDYGLIMILQTPILPGL